MTVALVVIAVITLLISACAYWSDQSEFRKSGHFNPLARGSSLLHAVFVGGLIGAAMIFKVAVPLTFMDGPWSICEAIVRLCACLGIAFLMLELAIRVSARP